MLRGPDSRRLVTHNEQTREAKLHRRLTKHHRREHSLVAYSSRKTVEIVNEY